MHRQAGFILEEEISIGLDELGVKHLKTRRFGERDTKDKVDFIVYTPHGRKNLEIQVTLRAKKINKIFGFAFRALKTAKRGIRLYLEVVGSHRRAANLPIIGRRVAKAIKLIAKRFRNFGPDNLLGVRVHAISAKIEKFDIIKLCGNRLHKALHVWHESRRKQQERRQLRLKEFFEKKRSEVPPWMQLRRYQLPQNQSFRPKQLAVNINPRFVPRRFC